MCSAGRGTGSQVKWQGTPPAAANRSDGTTVKKKDTPIAQTHLRFDSMH